MSSARSGPPKHQNKFAWKPNAGVKINETEVGGRLRPLSEITGVCPRCRGQIDWKRRYGKYKALKEPAKCQRCTKRNVRQAYHNLCPGCAKEQKVCAKCCSSVDCIVGRDAEEVEEEQKMLEEALKNARERDKRTLLRAINKEKSKSASKNKANLANKVGELFPSSSLEDYAMRNCGTRPANNNCNPDGKDEEDGEDNITEHGEDDLSGDEDDAIEEEQEASTDESEDHSHKENHESRRL